jgi:hypothetical protein
MQVVTKRQQCCEELNTVSGKKKLEISSGVSNTI